MSGLTQGIRQRVLVITLLPLLMITLLLGGYFIHTRLDDAQSALLEKGQIMSQMMASSAEFGLLTGNIEVLQGLIRSSIKAEEVDDVIFLNPLFETLARGQQDKPPLNKDAGYPLYKNNQVYFLHPVIATGVDVMDNPDFIAEETEPEFIGWVVIILSELPTQQRQFEILTTGILLALAGLLVTFFIASRFGQRITNPVLGLTHVVEMLQHGHLETRASISSTGELRSLAQGINKLAQRVQESNQSLESRVEKSTKRLRSTLVHLEKQNQALDRARKRADNANQAKDEFLARMSHELRTPLTSVSGFSRLLDQTELQDDQKEYTRIINLTSGLLLSIIDDILDFSKLESNAIELEHIPFEFESCIMDVMEMQTATAHEKGLELISVIAQNTPEYLVGDPVRMRQIITNLVSNAVKFTKSGQVSVTVSCQNHSSVDCELQIVVTDTGAGIPSDRAKNLFKAFSQADTSITRQYGGSGLGLVIAKRLTELMAGTIRLESVENKGTQVFLNIPFAASTRKRALPRYKLDTLIIFDRNPLIRSGLKNQLEKISSRIIESDSYESLKYDCEKYASAPIIWGIHTTDGISDDIDAIQSIDKQKNSPIIILSPTPLPLPRSTQLIQLRKPARTQLLYNALSPDSYKLTKEQESALTSIHTDSKVLVAEDNDFNRLLIKRILEQSGFHVIEATTGEEAVKHALSLYPDIILMDVHMPIMDGIEATAKIRLSQHDTPIIALTANVISSEHQLLVKAGVNHVLLKPINDRQLCHTIEQFLSHEDSFTLPNTTGDESTQLSRYNISDEELHNELDKQLEGIMNGFNQSDMRLMRHHSHQLIGLSGLYEIPELEVSSHNLHEALIVGDMKQIWKKLWQLKRLIEHEQYQHSEPL